MIVKTVSESMTTAIGRRITRRAVCDQRPSDFGTMALLRTVYLFMRWPRRAKIAGNGSKAASIAMATTVIPA